MIQVVKLYAWLALCTVSFGTFRPIRLDMFGRAPRVSLIQVVKLYAWLALCTVSFGTFRPIRLDMFGMISMSISYFR